jgi:putative ABC transport system ATP-binding protein
VIMVTHDPELARRAVRNIQIVDGQIADILFENAKRA